MAGIMGISSAPASPAEEDAEASEDMESGAREAFDAFMDASKGGDRELAFAAFQRAVMACSGDYSGE